MLSPTTILHPCVKNAQGMASAQHKGKRDDELGAEPLPGLWRYCASLEGGRQMHDLVPSIPLSRILVENTEFVFPRWSAP